ncbi:MAG TPA: outer membrane protein assembly factor BamE [Rhodanobacteraceae bacterium]|nr:outer membrane protein assembly factor BamE [Rhodanobacteraceae bacterium]
MRTFPTLLAAAALSLTMAGCSFVYKPNIQQGNVLDQAKVDQLKPGLTKEQVLALLGQPSVHSPFDQDRWDYVTTHQKHGGAVETRALTLYFENDVLSRSSGDIFAMTADEQLKAAAQYPMVLHNKKKEAEAKRRGGG